MQILSDKLEPLLLKTIKNYVLEKYPEEACGIISENSFIPLTNIHEEPTEHFRIAHQDFLPYLGKIDYIVHSHCKNPRGHFIFDIRTPSYNDIISQKQTGVKWLIFGTNGEAILEPIQVPRIPSNSYYTRPFIWYINDCFSLVQDFYKFELGIELENHKATLDYIELRKGCNLFDDYISEYGFTEYNPIGHEYQKGDLVLLDNAGFTRNHLGIYEDGFIIHQDALSKKERIEHFINRIHSVLRYENKDI